MADKVPFPLRPVEEAQIWVPLYLRSHAEVGRDGTPVVSCTAEEDMARQEYALSSDISYQISKFGVGHPGQSGSVNFDHMDLTKAHELIAAAQAKWLELPKAVRDRYQSWANVELAAKSGELAQVLKAAGAAAGSSGAAPAASASEAPPGEARVPAV